MTKCNRPGLRDRGLCHRCTRYRKAWANHYESALSCQPQVTEHAQHLPAQRRQHLKALRSIERDLSNLPAATTIPSFTSFTNFTGFTVYQRFEEL